MDCWSRAKILCDFCDNKINTDNKIRDTILINQKFDYLYTEKSIINGRKGIQICGYFQKYLRKDKYSPQFVVRQFWRGDNVVQGLFNVIKNLLLRKINPKTFLGTLGYQIGFDGAEFYLEKMLESIGYLIKEYNE